MAPIITLLTDFGTRDAYVASMKGVILGLSPGMTIVDISHDVPSQDAIAGAWVLASAFRYFPPGTVHVAIIDPGVGSSRRAVAARGGAWYFVGPDNGVLTWALDAAVRDGAVELNDPRWFRPEVSRTFHGRDIFAPVAAHLASGVPLDELGTEIQDLTPLPIPAPEVTEDRLTGEIVHVDHFGNAITNVDRATLDAWAAGRGVAVSVGGRRLDDVKGTYSDVLPGEPLALFESTDHLEVSVRDGSAERLLGVSRGMHVIVEAR